MSKLKVYYGWARIGNVRKKRALSIMFENGTLGCRSDQGHPENHIGRVAIEVEGIHTEESGLF